jgi:hypothetical protein
MLLSFPLALKVRNGEAVPNDDENAKKNANERVYREMRKLES